MISFTASATEDTNPDGLCSDDTPSLGSIDVYIVYLQVKRGGGGEGEGKGGVYTWGNEEGGY